MATRIRNVHNVLKPIVDAFNALKAQIGAGSNFHLDASELTVTFSSLSGSDADATTAALNAAYEIAWVFYKHRTSSLEHVADESATAPTKPATLAAAYTLINSTGTAGQLDDDATAGAEVIDGIALDAAVGGAAATAAGFINWPKVGRTL